MDSVRRIYQVRDDTNLYRKEKSFLNQTQGSL